MAGNWEEEARRYAQNVDYWRERTQSAEHNFGVEVDARNDVEQQLAQARAIEIKQDETIESLHVVINKIQAENAQADVDLLNLRNLLRSLTEKNEELKLQREKAQDWQMEARALLEEVLPDALPNWEKLIQCSICGCSAVSAEEIDHDDKCLIPRISAFLARKE